MSALASQTTAASDALVPPKLELIGITKRFPGVLANDDISLRVERGEILGLLGENGAGKSTLMNIVYGLQRPDRGEIRVDGRRVEISAPQDAVALRIGMVHQHFMLVEDMTVAENVALGPSLWPGRTRLAEVERRLAELSREFGLEIDPTAVVERLSVGARQRVEILKLLYRGADLLILDEPTAALTPGEWREFATFLRTMAGQGKAVIFITHKLDELLDLAHRCTVLRDGRVVGDVRIAEADKRSLARIMVGREVSLRAERPQVAPGRAVLEVDHLTVAGAPRPLLDDVSFAVHEGEVFGIAGVSGNGQNELVDAIVGLVDAAAGEARLDGARLTGGPQGFTTAGGALIPEGRHADAVALDMTVLDNLLVKERRDPRFCRRGILRPGAARAHGRALLEAYDVRGPGVDAPMRQLSGGNQQKAVLARELSRAPRLVIAFQPTLGLDVGAMEAVYRRLNECKQAGRAVLLISYELDEVLSLADRIAVLAGGRLSETLGPEQADPETVGLLMAGQGGVR